MRWRREGAGWYLWLAACWLRRTWWLGSRGRGWQHAITKNTIRTAALLRYDRRWRQWG